MSAPLRTVLAALTDGARSREAVVTATGLSRDVVDAALDHLVRMGRLDATALTVGCPDGGCGACPSGRGSAPGCGLPAPSGGPRLVSLSVRRPDVSP